MGLRLKHLVRVMLAAPVIATAVAGGVFYSADPDAMLGTLKTSLTEALGRTPEIEGTPKIEFWPIPGLRTGPVFVASANGGAAVITAESVLVTPSPLGLVIGEVRPWRLAFTGARLDARAISSLSGPQTASAIAVASEGVWISAPSASVRHGRQDYLGDVSIALSGSAFDEALDVSAKLTGTALSLGFDGRVGPAGTVIEIDGTATINAAQAQDLTTLAPESWTEALASLGSTEVTADFERRAAGDLIRVKLQTVLDARSVTGAATLRGAPGWRETGVLDVEGSLRSGGLATLYFNGSASPNLEFDGTASLSVQNLGVFGEVFDILPLVTRLNATDAFTEGSVSTKRGQVRVTRGNLRIGRNEVSASGAWTGSAGDAPAALDLRIAGVQPAMLSPGVQLTGDVDAHLKFAVSETDGRGWDIALKSGALAMEEGTWAGSDLNTLVRTGSDAPGDTQLRDLAVDVIQGSDLEIELATMRIEDTRYAGSGRIDAQTGRVSLVLTPNGASEQDNALRFSGPRGNLTVAAVPVASQTAADLSSINDTPTPPSSTSPNDDPAEADVAEPADQLVTPQAEPSAPSVTTDGPADANSGEDARSAETAALASEPATLTTENVEEETAGTPADQPETSLTPDGAAEPETVAQQQAEPDASAPIADETSTALDETSAVENDTAISTVAPVRDLSVPIPVARPAN